MEINVQMEREREKKASKNSNLYINTSEKTPF